MIEQDTLASAYRRNSIVKTHIQRHLHLTSSLHLQHRAHTEGAPFEKVDIKSVSPRPFGKTLWKVLMQEISSLPKRSAFRDPPVSPSCANLENVAITTKLPSVCCHTIIENAKQETIKETGASKKRKCRGKRVTRTKISFSRRRNCAMSTLGSACSSSKRSFKCLSSDRLGHTLACECKTHNLVLERSGKAQNNEKTSLSTRPNDLLSSKHAKSEHSLSPTSEKESPPLLKSFSEKYAPKSFADIVSQHVVKYALSNALSSRRVAPMYIFYGPHGTGKTSCAKLFALALNCLFIGRNKPCRTCRLCLAQLSGKLSSIKEVKGSVKCISSLMKDLHGSYSFLYRVCLVEECSFLSSKAWSALLKGIRRASKKTVFIFNTLSLEHIPHAILSQCQKFRFSNISERDIVCKLQMIAMRESLELDTQSIELIASTSNGSLYDAELMLDRCYSLGKKVTVPVVQDLVGLISDLRLMELLDSAFSAERVQTIQCLKAFFDSGVKPVNLLSQLASIITRILAGGYHVPRWEQERKFFRKKELTRDQTRRLRQALRILSDAEKQVQASSSGTTWLIAALLQFAPDRSCLLSSYAGTSLSQSPLRENTDSECDLQKPFKVMDMVEKPNSTHFPSSASASSDVEESAVNDLANLSAPNSSFSQLQAEHSSSEVGKLAATLKDMPPIEAALPFKEHESNLEIIKQRRDTEKDDLQQVWQRVLDAINSTNLKCFLEAEGKLVALSTHEDTKEALLEFHRLEHLSRVQRSKASIIHAFHATLGHRVKVKAHLVSCVNERRRSSSSTDAAKLGPSQWAQLVPSNNECSVSAPALQIHRFPLERRELTRKPSMSKDSLYDDIDKNVFSQEALQTKLGLHELDENKQFIGLPSLVEDSSMCYASRRAVEGCTPELQSGRLNLRPRGDSAEQETQKGKASATVASKLQKENLKRKESACWKASNHMRKVAESFQTCSEDSRFFLNFFPCASIPRSPKAL